MKTNRVRIIKAIFPLTIRAECVMSPPIVPRWLRRPVLAIALLAIGIFAASGLVAPAPVQAQGYPYVDCNNPYYYQYCQAYNAWYNQYYTPYSYGYADPYYAYTAPYYGYGVPVVLGLGAGFGGFRHHGGFRSGGFRGGAFHGGGSRGGGGHHHR